MATTKEVRVPDIGEFSGVEIIEVLVSPGDTAAFVSALVRLLSDDSLRRQLGTAARQRMLQHFTWPTLVDAVEDAYHREPDS